MISVSKHYDLLIENGNDPVLDGKLLSEYMNKWDGEEFINLLDLDKNKTVLEIGCGTGRIAKKIVDLCKIYVGIDVSQKTINVARNHFKKETNATFIEGDFLNYDFTKMYDVICSTLTFMHIQDKEYALTKIFSLLKQGGKAVLSIDKNQQTYINTGYSRITIFPDTPNTICGLLRQIGFSNIEVKEIEFAHIISCIKN